MKESWGTKWSLPVIFCQCLFAWMQVKCAVINKQTLSFHCKKVVKCLENIKGEYTLWIKLRKLVSQSRNDSVYTLNDLISSAFHDRNTVDTTRKQVSQQKQQNPKNIFLRDEHKLKNWKCVHGEAGCLPCQSWGCLCAVVDFFFFFFWD